MTNPQLRSFLVNLLHVWPDARLQLVHLCSPRLHPPSLVVVALPQLRATGFIGLLPGKANLTPSPPAASPIQRSCCGLKARVRANGCNEDKNQGEGEQEKEQQQDEQHEDEEKGDNEEETEQANNDLDENEDEEEGEHVASEQELEEQGDEDKDDDEKEARKNI